MQQLINGDFESLKGKAFDCKCGEKHSVGGQSILFGNNKLSELSEAASKLCGGGNVLLVTKDDNNSALEQRIIRLMTDSGFQVVTHSYARDVLNTLFEGSMLFNYPENIRLVVAVGSDIVIDLAKYFCSVAELPLIAIPTGIGCVNLMSNFSVISVDGVNQMLVSKYVDVVMCDFEILRVSDKHQIATGFGYNMSALAMCYDRYFTYSALGEKSRKYCNVITESIENLVNNNLMISDAITRGEHSAIIANFEYTLRIGMLLNMGQLDRSSSAILAALTLDIIKRIKVKQGTHYMELYFLVANKLVKVYKSLAEFVTEDIAIPPDIGMRAEIIAGLFNLDRFEVFTSLKMNADKNNYFNMVERFNEYRDDIICYGQNIMSVFERGNKAHRRIYADLRCELDGYVDGDDMALAAAISSDIFDEFTPLTLIREMGLSDRYLNNFEEAYLKNL